MKARVSSSPSYQDSLPPSSNTKTAMEQTFARVQLLLSFSAAFAKYIYIKETKNWQEAQEYCRRCYTDLAPISNGYDMEHLRMLSNNNARALMWIGMQRNLTNKKEWTWSGGGVVSTSLWAPGQPNNGILENHGVILDYMLHDAETTRYEINFFCYSAVVVRERKTWEEALEYCRGNHSDLASSFTASSKTSKLVGVAKAAVTKVTEWKVESAKQSVCSLATSSRMACTSAEVERLLRGMLSMSFSA
ncbi:L-selectin [Liparis tanakae]|uniref:L-selectin n=1 Tax=Liparis tanakae TaxID=230148 RepID=A0A4Z2ICL4_9TELE|nr:L-selectin [Liparis tanakae]